MSEPEIVELDAIDCRLEQRPWRFAEENAEAIRAHWQKVIEAKPASFTISLIPETLARTTLGFRQVGDRVNLEADILAKHVEKLLQNGATR